MEINRAAPLLIRREIEIFAPPETVWERISRVELWRDWRPDVSSSHWTDGQQGPRARFYWRLRGLIGVRCEVESWSVTREMGWSGRAAAASVRQVFRLSGDFRRTTLITEISLEGGVLGFGPLRSYAESLAVNTTETMLGALKTKLEAEKVRVRIDATPPAGLPQKSAAKKPVLPSQRTRYDSTGWK